MAIKYIPILVALLPALTLAQTYTATFTEYGSGDGNGSGNCNTKTYVLLKLFRDWAVNQYLSLYRVACGYYTSPGYSAAVSQNLYGAGPGAGAGPACGGCWQITGQKVCSYNCIVMTFLPNQRVS